MKWLLDENGNIVLRNGKPVAVGADGQEFEYDIELRNQQLVDTVAEATKHRKGKAELKAIIEKLPEEVIADPSKYVQALATVDSLDDKNKSNIETLRKELQASYDSSVKEKDERIQELENGLYKEKVTTKFATSEAFKGTVFDGTREVAESFFSSRFAVDEKGNMVGTKEDGSTIYSKEKPGEPAGFDECIHTLIHTHPKRDNFLSPSNQRGGGTPPGGDNQGGVAKTSTQNISEGLAARKNNA